jgi:hypothetical protein
MANSETKLLLSRWLAEGVPSRRGVIVGDEAREEEFVVPPDDPLFWLAVYEEAERRGMDVGGPDAPAESMFKALWGMKHPGVKPVKWVTIHGHPVPIFPKHGGGVMSEEEAAAHHEAAQEKSGGMSFGANVTEEQALKVVNKIAAMGIPSAIKDAPNKPAVMSIAGENNMTLEFVATSQADLKSALHHLAQSPDYADSVFVVLPHKVSGGKWVFSVPKNWGEKGEAKKDEGSEPVRHDLSLGKKLQYVSAAGGTQGARWFVNSETGERWVVKSYSDPDRVATEALANAIYAKLGVPVPEAAVTEVEGKKAFASKEVKGSLKPEINADEKLQDGFMADAYLGSWDVVGLGFDNILYAHDGTPYRIDVGGTLFYRAQGKKKDFPSEVTEHETLLDAKKNPQAAKAFKGITKRRMREQAAHIAATLTDDWIDKAVDSAGFSSPAVADAVRTALKGRRDWMKKFAEAEQPAKAEMEAPASPAPKEAVEAVTEETIRQVEKKGVYGRALHIGGGAFKGGSVHATMELSPQGGKELVLYGKLRAPVEESLWQKVAGVVAAHQNSSEGLYNDSFYDILLAAAKTINHHLNQGDHAYNKSKLGAAVRLIAAADKDSHEYKHHAKQIQEIMENYEKIKAGKYDEVKEVSPVTPAPPPEKKPKPSDEIMPGVRLVKLTAATGVLEKSQVQVEGVWMLKRGEGWVSKPLGMPENGVAIHMETDEAYISYFPSARPDTAAAANPWTRQGYLEVRSKDGSIESARKALEKLGVPSHDTTREEAEDVYLSRLAWWLKREKDSAFEEAHKKATAAERVAAKRAVLSNIVGKDVTQLEGYDPTPKIDARGQAFYLAPVIPGIELPKAVSHTVKYSSNSILTVIERMNNSGVFSFESTEQRLRKGILQSGWSSQSDFLYHGSANFFFVYPRKKSGKNYVIFHGDVLRRLDSFAHSHDAFGDITPEVGLKQRLSPQQFYFAREAMVSGGIGFDYVMEMRVGSASEQGKVIEILKKNGITHIGTAFKKGGIPVEDAVKVVKK